MMKIQKILVYRVELPLVEGFYAMSDGKVTEGVFDTTVVQIDTDAGITGYGEVCPLGCNYLPSYPEGVRTGIQKLGPDLIGEDPLELGCLNDKMDSLLKGHPYVKSAIDMACWDILGKFTKLPVCTLLGGRFGDTIKLYRAISIDTPENMSKMVKSCYEDGYRKFQIKVGRTVQDDYLAVKASVQALEDKDDPDKTFIMDANCGWTSGQALQFLQSIKNMDSSCFYLEQPCITYEECLRVRRHTHIPFVLDEVIDSIPILVRAQADGAADVVNLKISKLGGITKMKKAIDLCVSVGIPMTIEDSWGSDIITAAIAHLNHSTPERYRFSTLDFNSYHTVSIASGAPQRKNGTIQASTEPGLGIHPRMEVLGEPVFVI